MRAGSRSTAKTWAPAAASCAVLPPGAAQRSATRSPGCGGEQPGGQGGGGVLHPEPALGVARQVVHAGAGGKRTEPVGSTVAARRRRGAGREREVERRLVRVRLGDGAGVGAPARPEPGRRVEPRPVQPVERRRPGLGDPAQHGVHQPGEAAPACARGPGRRRCRPPHAAACRAAAARPRRAAARGAPRRAARG